MTGLALAATATLMWGASSARSAEGEPTAVPGEFIVKLKGDSAPALRAYAAMLDELGAREVNALKVSSVYRKIHVPGMPMHEALRRLNASPAVEYANPNVIIRLDTLGADGLVLQNPEAMEDAPAHLPADKLFDQQWALRNNGGKVGQDKFPALKGADIKGPEAWAARPESLTAAAGVVVAIVDTGINLKHKDLNHNLWRNRGEEGPWTASTEEEEFRTFGCKDKSCNQIDDDGNGYVDDSHGWNWAVKVRPGEPLKGNNNPNDDMMHGSHVSGIIGASHNERGVAGTNAKVQLMALRFLDKRGSGTLEGGMEAIGYAVKMGALVVNASWGTTETVRPLCDVIAEAGKKGMFFAVAAGNAAEDNDFLPRSPANCPAPEVLSVVASDPRDGRASFSSFGRKRAHLAAPGYSILSTVKGQAYQMASGTSMATPYVAGAAAMMIGLNPELVRKPADVKRLLMDTSDLTPVLASASVSGGRLNLLNAVLRRIPVNHERPDGDRWSGTVRQPVETEHPYANGQRTETVIRHPGAKWLRVRFGRYSIERERDRVEIYDADGNLFDVVTGFGTSAVTRAIKGDTAKLVFVSDATVGGWGFEVHGYEHME